jgi:hypothetical protein
MAVYEKERLAALSMLHKAKKAYYACDVIRFLVPHAARLKLLVFFASPLPLPSMNRVAARTGCAVHFSLFSRVTLTDEVSGQA